MFKLLWVVGLLSVAAIPAIAQSSDYPRAEFGGGYSFIRANIKSTDAAVPPNQREKIRK
jgi:hypothetical protein